jgi:hypothetical protein
VPPGAPRSKRPPPAGLQFESAVWRPWVLSKEQLSCSDLTGLRVRSERCCGDSKRLTGASGSCPAG